MPEVPRRVGICRLVALGVVALLAIAAQAADRAVITLSLADDRLGPISAATPFSAAKLRSLFPAATVTEGSGATEGEPYPLLRVADDRGVLLEVTSADGRTIHAIEIMAGVRVENLDVRPGDTYAQVFGEGPGPACVPGLEERSGEVICPAPSSSHVTLVFDGDWAGPDGQLPPPDVLQDWTVAHVIWRP
jgi:hypothetical protein